MCTLATMLLGTPSFLAPGISSLLLLFISLVDDDPVCDEAEEGVLALLPPLASTLRIGRTTCRSRLRVNILPRSGSIANIFHLPSRGSGCIVGRCGGTWTLSGYKGFGQNTPMIAQVEMKRILPDGWSPARRRSHHYLLLSHKLCHRDSTCK